MNKVFLFSFILMFSYHSFGQVNIDSLWAVWSNNKLTDTTRLNAIYEIGRELRGPKPDSAIYYALIQKDYADKKGLSEYTADALYTIGKAYDSKGELVEAQDFLERAHNLYQEVGNNQGRADALYGIGLVKWTAGEYDVAKEYHHRSMAISDDIGDKKGVARCLNGIAYCYFQQGQYVTAAEHVQKSLKISEELKDDDGISWCLNAIGVFYSRGGDREKALEYYLKALEINERIGDQISIAYSLRNIGSSYSELGNAEKALEYYEKSLKISEEMNDKRSIALSLSILGNLNLKRVELETAMDYFRRALAISIEIGNRDMEAEDLQAIGQVHMEQGNYLAGILEFEKSYDIAMEIGSITDQLAACKSLYEANKALGKYSKALEYHEEVTLLEDSINFESINRNLQKMEFDKKVLLDSIAKANETRLVEEAHQEEIRKKNQSRNIGILIGVFIILLAAGLYSRLRYTRKAKVDIEKERDRSDNLLLNILPAEIAEELKEKGSAAARDFNSVSILFTDFKDFTKASAKMSAKDLVEEINTCFKAFDKIIGKYGIEKIKTIGDAYMAAGGLPIPTVDSVKNTVLAALEMQDYITKRKIDMEAKGLSAFEMRCGIHTGPVVAGIVGIKKFQYDVWGDTVNTASRMESNSETGKVNISQHTYELINQDKLFNFENRGEMKVKGKGEIEMWFVDKR